MLGAPGVQILVNNLDDLDSSREEDGTLETMDPQDLLGSFLLADNHFPSVPLKYRGWYIRVLVIIFSSNALCPFWHPSQSMAVIAIPSFASRAASTVVSPGQSLPEVGIW
ncbi:hypothetical protein Tco_1175658 [Tanacetum coccineum]